MSIEENLKPRSPLGDWEPNELAFIERLEYVADSDTGGSVTIVGLFQERRDPAWPNPAQPTHRVTMLFEGVGSLDLKKFGGATQIMGFEITSIADRAWESLNFEVGDYEDGRIHFYCASVCVVETE